MDPERWPEFVRSFVDEIGVRSREWIIQVDYHAPVWIVTAKCPCCGTEVRWTLLAGEPLPAPVTTAEPAWYRKLDDLPPGGTT